MRIIIKPLIFMGVTLIGGAMLLSIKTFKLHNYFYINTMFNLLMSGFGMLGVGMILLGFHALKERTGRRSILIGVISLLFGVGFVYLAWAFVPDGQMRCVLSGNEWCT